MKKPRVSLGKKARGGSKRIQKLWKIVNWKATPFTRPEGQSPWQERHGKELATAWACADPTWRRGQELLCLSQAVWQCRAQHHSQWLHPSPGRPKLTFSRSLIRTNYSSIIKLWRIGVIVLSGGKSGSTVESWQGNVTGSKRSSLSLGTEPE